jgi:Transcriptional regulator, AbiEi antitoxin
MSEGGWETGNTGPFRDQPRRWTAVVAVAGQQHTVIRLDQLIDLGWSATAVRKRCAAGHLFRRYRGVYTIVPPNLLTREGRWLAAVFAAGPGAVLSHRAAGALHALRAYNGAAIDLTIPTRSMRRHPGIRIHRSTTLTADDVTVENGIPCTSVARTLFDLAEIETRRGLERAFDQSEILEVFDLRAIQDQLDRNPLTKAATLIRAVLDEHYVGRTPTWNEFEEAMYAICRAAGVRDPEVNQWLVLDDGGPAIRPDFMWRPELVVVETDGRRTHGTRQRFESDRRKDQRLTAAGWRSIRTTWRQVFRRPREVQALLVAVVSGAPARRRGPRSDRG